LRAPFDDRQIDRCLSQARHNLNWIMKTMKDYDMATGGDKMYGDITIDALTDLGRIELAVYDTWHWVTYAQELIANNRSES
jgi:hypothetical protein